MREKKSKRVVYILLGFAIISAWLFGTRSAHLADTISSYLMYPVLYVEHKVADNIKAFFAHKYLLNQYEQEIGQLTEQNDALLQENIELQALVCHQEDIQELVDFKENYNTGAALLSQILVKQFGDDGHYYIIDKGADAGVKIDMAAVHKNCLVGKVVEVMPHYSKVLLITDRMCKVAACCANTHVAGIAQGANTKNSLNLSYISHLAEIEPDDLVLSSGEGLVFPKGFALGKITQVVQNELFYDIAVQPLIDLTEIPYCYVLAKGAGYNQENSMMSDFDQLEQDGDDMQTAAGAVIINNNELSV